MFDGAARAARSAREWDVQMAYLNASLGRAKKMPPLNKLLPKKPVKRAKPADWKTMYQAAEAWAR